MEMNAYVNWIFGVLTFLSLVACDNHKKTEKYDSGNIKSIGMVRDGEKDGNWVYFTENGDTLKIKNYVLGELKFELIFRSKKIYRKTTYKESNSISVEIFYENGNRKCFYSVENNVYNGYCECFYENGQLQTSFNMSNGEPFGEFKEYYQNGSLKATAETYGEGVHIFFDSLGNSKAWHFENFERIDSLENYAK